MHAVQSLEYLPYSHRHHINDPDLAGLLDYLERVMGWDIEIKHNNDSRILSIESAGWHLGFGTSEFVNLFHREDYGDGQGRVELYLDHMRPEIFFRSYKTLLPVIRDLQKVKF